MFLISLLRLYSDANFIIPNSEIIDFKEALIPINGDAIESYLNTLTIFDNFSDDEIDSLKFFDPLYWR